ncbi:MAG: hypothetical protein JRI23_12795 [Deltaproteobacteria bacterium]|nr:hypothetical protein [Deltaproteobacteria bacterium]
MPCHHAPPSPVAPSPRTAVDQPARARRWAPAVLTVLAAALVVGGLIRLATDDRVVEVVSFREGPSEPSVSELAAALTKR